MKQNKEIALLGTAFMGVAAIAAAFFLLIAVFGGAPADGSGMALRLILPLALYILVCAVLAAQEAKRFEAEQFKTGGPGAYREALKNLGAAPLKALVLIAACSLVFLFPSIILGFAPGIAPPMKTPLFLLCLAVALLGAAFVYVFWDRLVTRTLLDNSLTAYPRDLREGRQSLKLFILPVAVTVISVLYATGLCMLTAARTGKPAREMGAGDWALLWYLIIPFFIIVLSLDWLIKKNTSALYSTVIAQLENLSSAKKDLTRRVYICSVDEVGTIAGMVNDFSENMEQGMREIKNSQRMLSASGVSLKQEAGVMADSLSRLSGGMERVRQESGEQTRGVGESSAAVEAIAKNIAALDHSITLQSSSAGQASAAVEELVGNIRSIGSMVDRMLDQFKTVAAAASEGGRIQQESGERVREIVAESEALQEANRIIATIAAQTNLLAMNAAIEAAHAGDAGRGFAVVADEIRKLAETSSRESAKISAELKQIAGTIDGIVKGSGASTQAFTLVAGRVSETGKLVYEVNNAIKEQQEGADQVLRSLRAMNGITGEVGAGSKEMSRGNEIMLMEMAKLRDSARQIAGSIDEMAAGVAGVSGGAQKVSELAENNQEAISGINHVVDGFEV
jgi:methyl-accepting chemotaxis protein